MKLTDNFTLEEFIDPATFQKRGPASVQLLDWRLVQLMEFTREKLSAHFGQEVHLLINNWATGGQFKLNGFRPFDSSTGAAYSQHKFGRATDPKPYIKSNGQTVFLNCDTVRQAVLLYEQEFMQAGLTTLEDGQYAPTWVHMDIRYTGLNKILIVKP